MKKKHCKNCKWHQNFTQIIYNGGYDCVVTKVNNDYVKGCLDYHRICRFTNEDGLCQDYKHKWWKFWV